MRRITAYHNPTTDNHAPADHNADAPVAMLADYARQVAPPVKTPAPKLISATCIFILIFGSIAFLYFAREVVLPVVLAVVGGMTLKPLVQWLSRFHIPTPFGAGLVVAALVFLMGFGFVQVGRPTVQWMNDAPANITKLKARLHNIFPPAAQLGQVADAVKNLEAKEDDQKHTQTVQLKDNGNAGTVIDWTGSLAGALLETGVLLFMLLAAGDTFQQKLVRVIPRLRDKKRAVEINREIQQNISNYLFTISLINFGIGLLAGTGFYLMGVPNPAMWGLFAALLNYVPYFGPIGGIAVMALVGILTFDTLPREFLPAGWYLVLHILEADLVTPFLLGRKFTLNPVIIFVSLIFWTWIWGVPGALLSMPMLMSAKAVCDRVPSLAGISQFLVDREEEPSPGQ
jgi:predicted PurR-regulated permease PerM